MRPLITHVMMIEHLLMLGDCRNAQVVVSTSMDGVDLGAEIGVVAVAVAVIGQRAADGFVGVLSVS